MNKNQIGVDKLMSFLYTFFMEKLFNKLAFSVLAADVPIGKAELGFTPPDLAQVITFALRGLFVVAGLAALLYLLLGAFAWITSGGNKESVDKAREKIQAAVIGLILIFVVLAIVVLLEKVLKIGLGISEPIVFPKLIQ